MLSRLTRRAIAAGLVPMTLLVSSLPAQGPTAAEVEAAFLLNFTKFVEWPDDAFPDGNAPFAICVVGKDPFGHALDDMVAQEKVGQRDLAVRRLPEVPQGHGCQVVFLNVSGSAARENIVRLNSGVLSVGEGSAFLQAGGMVAFVVDNRRVRFDINQALAEKNGLKLSSRLLTVARSVQK